MDDREDDGDGDVMAAVATPQAGYPLADPMARRMAELSAEVKERLSEMARICELTVVRADPPLGRLLQGQPSTLVFRPHRHGGGKGGPGTERLMDAITVVRYGSGPNMSLCYNEVQGVCYRC